VGQIPARLEKLTYLGELNLEADSLTGELPKDFVVRSQRLKLSCLSTKISC
jgi:hypothetical protein